jgi:arginyl-tRNA synthetase
MNQSGVKGLLEVQGKNKMKKQIENLIKESLKKLDIEVDNVFVEHPIDLKMGDFSTNIALSQAKKQNINPKELADKIAKELNLNLGNFISKIEVAGPGFINFYLSREFFTNTIKDVLEKGKDWGRNHDFSGKKIMVEYTDPNPFKPFHIGHLMTNAIGESISRIVEFSGANVVRANYQGDIGPHVAKAIYGLIKFGMPSESKSISEQAQHIGECYSKSSNLYDTDEDVKKEINEINKKIYDRSDEKINNIYDWGRRVTLEAFEEIYKILGTKFEYYFFESDMAPVGEKVVKENIGKIFEESDGAVVFHGENYDKKLHTRVFINSQSLPTYETKEIGLTMTKFEKENPDTSIVVTAIEQAEYMKVVQKAISLIHPDFESRMRHITHGMMRFASGKMSSRKGNVVTGESLLRDSMDVVLEKVKDREFNDEEKNNISRIVGVSALKYSILRSSLGSDIIYDFEKSISFEGDSGPYLQYTAVRANSILNKAKELNLENKNSNIENDLEITELEKTLYKFPEVVENSNILLEPHHIATYLTELAGSFNAFYANTKILNEENKNITYHLNLVKSFYQTMKNGLYLLGVETPEKM